MNTLKTVTWNFNPGFQSATNKQNPYSHFFNFSLRSQDLNDQIQEQSSSSAFNLTHTKLRESMEETGEPLLKQEEKPKGKRCVS